MDETSRVPGRVTAEGERPPGRGRFAIAAARYAVRRNCSRIWSLAVCVGLLAALGASVSLLVEGTDTTTVVIAASALCAWVLLGSAAAAAALHAAVYVIAIAVPSRGMFYALNEDGRPRACVRRRLRRHRVDVGMHATTGPGPWAGHLRTALRSRLADELVTRELWLTAPSSSLADT